MSGAEAEQAGPALEAAVAVGEIPDGGMLAVHAGGKADDGQCLQAELAMERIEA